MRFFVNVILSVWFPTFFIDCSNIIAFMIALIGSLCTSFLPIGGHLICLPIWIVSIKYVLECSIAVKLLFSLVFLVYIIYGLMADILLIIVSLKNK